MARARPAAKTRPSEPPAPGADWPARLTQWAFILALALVCARATMTEILYDVVAPAPGVDGAPSGPGPAISLLLDLMLCVPALLVLVRRAIDHTYVIRLAWSHAAMAGLALWIAASVLWSADRFAAMISAAGFISGLVLLWSATQLVRSWKRFRLVAAAAFGLLLIYLACGAEYRLIDLPEYQRDWLENRERILRGMGHEPGSFAAESLGQKIMAGDIGCFSSSPNTYAAVIVMMVIVAAGIIIQRAVSRDPPGWIIAIAVALPPAAYILYHTHSLTAFITPLLAAAILAAIAPLRRWLAARHKTAYCLGVSAFVLGAALVITHGLYHQSLIVRTLTFRWHYWSGAARLVAEHPAAGVGWNNFGLHYPAVRGPLAVEEVKDPHNFIVRAFAELGLIGGALMIAWMLRFWWELTRPVHPPEVLVPAGGRKLRPMLLLTLLAALAMGLNLLLSLDLARDPAYSFFQAFRRAVAFLLLLAGLAAGALHSMREEKLDERPAPWLLYGVLTAVGIFLIHNLVDFSLFETSSLPLFALLAGSALGLRQPSLAGRRRKPLAAVSILTAAVLLWLLAMGALWAPVASAEADATEADELLRAGRPSQAARLYTSAREHLPINANYALRAAQAMIYDDAPPRQVHAMLDAAIAANPRAVRHYTTKAEYERRQPTPDVSVVRHAYQEALRLNPRDVPLRLDYAEALAALGDRAAAADQFREALLRDDQLPPDEPRRLSPQRRGEIAARIRRLESAADSR